MTAIKASLYVVPQPSTKSTVVGVANRADRTLILSRGDAGKGEQPVSLMPGGVAEIRVPDGVSPRRVWADVFGGAPAPFSTPLIRRAERDAAPVVFDMPASGSAPNGWERREEGLSAEEWSTLVRPDVQQVDVELLGTRRRGELGWDVTLHNHREGSRPVAAGTVSLVQDGIAGSRKGPILKLSPLLPGEVGRVELGAEDGLARGNTVRVAVRSLDARDVPLPGDGESYRFTLRRERVSPLAGALADYPPASQD